MMQTFTEIKDFTDVLEFTDGYYKFKKDNRARASLNKTLETNYKAVYRQDTCYKDQWKNECIDFSGETFYVVTENGRLIEFKNSVWAWIEVMNK
jgi:hypothetical protein